jgi:SAM-dependent methyltransferase
MTEELAKVDHNQLTPQLVSQLKAQRKPLEGVTNIVRFNWPFFLMALILVFGYLAFLYSRPLPVHLGPLNLLVGIVFNWFFLSLSVSFFVYDTSGLYQFGWLLNNLKHKPQTILNLHAGFDETSKGLRILFPDAEIKVFYFYSPKRSTEPSIARARAVRTHEESISVDIVGWELADNSQDLVQVFMSAHELRKPADREALFKEIYRVLKPEGLVVVVEHLRDFANFVAFGPGFFHFYSHSEWLRVADKCGFFVSREEPVKIFVRVFFLCKK